MPKPYANWRQRLVFILLTLYTAFVYMFDGSETNVRFIYLAYGLLCLFYLFFISWNIKLYSETFWLMAYLAFGIISLLWAEDVNTAFSRVRGVFLLLVFVIFATTYAIQERSPIMFIYALIVGALSLSVYMFVIYGFSGMMTAMRTGNGRIGSEINNVNAIGNSLAVGMVATIGMAVFYKKWAVLLLLFPMVMSMIITGSRTAVLSLLAGVLTIVLLAQRSRKNPIQKTLGAIVLLIGVWAATRNFPATRELVLRLENALFFFTGKQSVFKESSVEMRMDFIELGWQAFLRSPIWGNGIGCAGYAIQEEYNKVTYLHNNYIEILASGGIIGFILYYTPYVLVFRSLRNWIFNYKVTNPIIGVSFALLVSKMIGHMGTVMYYSKIEYVLIALWITVSRTEYLPS